MRMARRERRLKLMLNAGVVATLLPKSSVFADSYAIGPTSGGWKGDNATHTYCFNGLDADSEANADAAMLHLDNNTDITQSCIACSESTDARIESKDLAGNTRGDYSCRVTVVSGKCGSARVRIDEDAIDAQNGDFEFNLDKTLRHELGHSVGLTHYSGDETFPAVQEGAVTDTDDCMVSGPVNGDSQWVWYTTHRKDHINAGH